MRGSTGWATVCGAVLMVSGAEILTHGPLTRTDTSVQQYYTFHSHASWIRLAQWLAELGQPWLACAVVGGLAGFVSWRTQRIGPILAAAVGLGIVGVGTSTLKAVFPHASIYLHQPGSFPSGHTGVAVIAAGLVVRLVLPLRHRREVVVLILAGLWGALMGWGRLVVEAHWLSDVCAGWSLGMIALVIALRIVEIDTPPRAWTQNVIRRAGSWRGSRGSASPVPGGR